MNPQPPLPPFACRHTVPPKGPKRHRSEKCDELLRRSGSVSALPSRSEGSHSPGARTRDLLSHFFLIPFGGNCTKAESFHFNPCWKEAALNSSCPGVDLGRQQGGNLVNKPILPDFHLIPALTLSPPLTGRVKEWAAWKIPLPKLAAAWRKMREGTLTLSLVLLLTPHPVPGLLRGGK